MKGFKGFNHEQILQVLRNTKIIETVLDEEISKASKKIKGRKKRDLVAIAPHACTSLVAPHTSSVENSSVHFAGGKSNKALQRNYFEPKRTLSPGSLA